MSMKVSHARTAARCVIELRRAKILTHFNTNTNEAHDTRFGHAGSDRIKKFGRLFR